MAKVTSKLQVTVPKVIAEQYHIHPGDEIGWQAAGDAIRVVPPGRQAPPQDRKARLHLFDQATDRHGKRWHERWKERALDRGWTREDLYRRGRSH